MFLLVLSFYFVSKGQNFVSAGCFVLASIKVTPMVFILWFVLKKKWTFLFYVILIFVGSYLVLHINSTNGIENEISAWLSLSTQMKAAKGELTLISNQSLVGAFSRILNSSKLGSLTAIGFGGFLILVVSGLTLMDRSEVGSFSLCFVLMLLLSPDTRSAHMVHLTIPMVFIFKCFVKRGGIDLFYLGSSFVAILFATQDLIGLRASNWALSNNLFTYYMMIIFGFCGYFILKSKVMVEKDIAKRPYQMLS